MSHKNAATTAHRRNIRAKTAILKDVARRQTLLLMESLENRCLLSAILGSAGTFTALAASTVTSSGATVLNGNLGVYPGTSITGFPPGAVTPPGQIHQTDAVAQQAEVNAMNAYNTLMALPVTQTLTGQNLGGLTLTPGVYKFASSAQLTGTLTLNAQNDSNAMFVFQIGSTLTTASASTVQLINAPAGFANVFWQVGSSATLGSASSFYGAIIAEASITMNTAAVIAEGNALALTGAVTLLGNTISANLDGTISDVKFQDTNGNGVRDPGEPGIAGVTLFLDLNGDDKLDIGDPSTVTGANGDYLFSNVAPGTYTVRELVPTGWVQTTANPTAVMVLSGTDVAGGNFGDAQLGQISGTKFQDVNGNGIQDAGEPGFSGVTMFLDLNDDDKLDAGDPSTVTGDHGSDMFNGSYVFNNVAPGTYTVREVVPAGWVQTTANPAAVTVLSGGNVAGGNIGDFQLNNYPLTHVSYSITHKHITTTVNTMTGHVLPGDTVKMNFTVPAGEAATLSLASYTAPNANAASSESSLQALYDQSTASYGPGRHTLTVHIPNAPFFQIDFVSGAVIAQFGPIGSNIFYTSQGRLIAAAV